MDKLPKSTATRPAVSTQRRSRKTAAIGSFRAHYPADPQIAPSHLTPAPNQARSVDATYTGNGLPPLLIKLPGTNIYINTRRPDTETLSSSIQYYQVLTLEASVPELGSDPTHLVPVSESNNFTYLLFFGTSGRVEAYQHLSTERALVHPPPLRVSTATGTTYLHSASDGSFNQ